MDKRGQIYIVSAIIIVIIVSGLFSVSTFASVKQSPKIIYEIKSDLKKESYEIVDYGIYNNKKIEKLLDDFVMKDFGFYFLQKTDKANIIFVYGNKTSLKSVKYDTVSTGTITVKIGGRVAWENFGTFVKKMSVVPISEEEIKVTLLNKEYKFKLRDNEMFYFIIVQKKGDEIYVEKNE